MPKLHFGMALIQRGAGGRIAILGEDISNGLPRQRLAETYVTFLARREAELMTEADEAVLAAILKDFTTAAEKGGDWHAYRRWRWLSTYRHPTHLVDGTSSLLSLA